MTWWWELAPNTESEGQDTDQEGFVWGVAPILRIIDKSAMEATKYEE